LGVTSHAPGSAKSVREWTFTLPSEFPCWELESQMESESSEHDYRGQNSSPWNVLYSIGKLLKCKCLKWARIAHLDIWNTSYGQNSGIDPISLCASDVQHTVRKLLTRATTLLQTSSRSEVRTKSYAPSKSQESQLLDVAPVERRKIYYKGEGGGFPQVRAVMSLVCLSCPWLFLAPKVFQHCTNHLVLVLGKLVWVSKACHFLLVPSQRSSTPLYPSIVLQVRERARLLMLPLFSIWDLHLSPSRNWECVRKCAMLTRVIDL
jgi:hypothetical protein